MADWLEMPFTLEAECLESPDDIFFLIIEKLDDEYRKYEESYGTDAVDYTVVDYVSDLLKFMLPKSVIPKWYCRRCRRCAKGKEL